MSLIDSTNAKSQVKRNIYLAAPFFSKEQNERFETVYNLLSANPNVGYIFAPKEHQHEELFPDGMPEEERMATDLWKRATFSSDIRQVDNAGAVVAILDYDVENGVYEPDSGTVYEIARAHTLGIPVIMVTVDEHNSKNSLNLMLWGAGTAFFEHDNLDDLATYNFVDFPQMVSTRKVF